MSKNKECSVCVFEKATGTRIDETQSNVAWADRIGVSEASVRRHKKHAVPATQTTEKTSSGFMSVTAVRDRPVTLQDARDWVSSTGDDPDDYELSIKSIAYGYDMFSNKMSATPKKGRKVEVAGETVDPIALLKELRDGRTYIAQNFKGDSTFGFAGNDWQYGKSTDEGGVKETTDLILRSTEKAVKRVKWLRNGGYDLGKGAMAFVGDLVEGCFIYPNMSFNLELSRKDQIEGVIALGLHVIDELAPLFDEFQVFGTLGNHGEHRYNGNRTDLADNDDTHCVEMMKLALSRDPNMQHITWNIARGNAGVVGDLSGWKYAFTHGDVYGKNVPGASIEKKAYNWYKNMAAGRDPIGLADVMVTAHFHHEQTSDMGPVFWQQLPAQDMGMSEYFRQTTGTYSEPGMMTWVVTPDDRYAEARVMR